MKRLVAWLLCSPELLFCLVGAHAVLALQAAGKGDFTEMFTNLFCAAVFRYVAANMLHYAVQRAANYGYSVAKGAKR